MFWLRGRLPVGGRAAHRAPQPGRTEHAQWSRHGAAGPVCGGYFPQWQTLNVKSTTCLKKHTHTHTHRFAVYSVQIWICMQTIHVGPLCMHPLPLRFMKCETRPHGHAHFGRRRLVNRHCLCLLWATFPSCTLEPPRPNTHSHTHTHSPSRLHTQNLEDVRQELECSRPFTHHQLTTPYPHPTLRQSPWLRTIATPPLLQKATRTPARNLRFFKRTSGAAMKSNTCTTLFCSEVSRGCLNNRSAAHRDLSVRWFWDVCHRFVNTRLHTRIQASASVWLECIYPLDKKGKLFTKRTFWYCY